MSCLKFLILKVPHGMRDKEFLSNLYCIYRYGSYQIQYVKLSDF